MPPVAVDASRTNRSLQKAVIGPAPRPQLKADPVLKAWRILIDHAIADAKKTRFGLSTDKAIMARWWLQEFRPSQSDKEEWERSFECACHWLGLNVDEERKRALDEIDDAVTKAIVQHAGSVTYRRRAAVLSCAMGQPIAIAGRYVLALVSEEDYEQVALIDRPDPPPSKRKRKQKRIACSI